jgi:hypothetical protein
LKRERISYSSLKSPQQYHSPTNRAMNLYCARKEGGGRNSVSSHPHLSPPSLKLQVQEEQLTSSPVIFLPLSNSALLFLSSVSASGPLSCLILASMPSRQSSRDLGEG